MLRFGSRLVGGCAAVLSACGPQVESPGAPEIALSRSNRIEVIEGDGRASRSLTDPPEGAIDRDPTWSPSGLDIAFTRAWGNEEELLSVNLASGEVRRLAEARAIQPAWSPDGSEIAFASHPRGVPSYESQYDLLVVSTSDAREIRLVDTPNDTELQPTWSPDGSRIVFFQNLGPRSEDETAVVERASGVATAVADGSSARLWLPDSSGLLLWVRGTLQLVDLNKGSNEVVFEDDAVFYGFRWSPVAPEFALTRMYTGTDGEIRCDLHVMRWPSLDQERVAEAEPTFCYGSPTWSPDGLRIAATYDNFAPLDDPEPPAALHVVDLVDDEVDVVATDVTYSADWRCAAPAQRCEALADP